MVGEDVNYISHTSAVSTKRKTGVEEEIPMEQRFLLLLLLLQFFYINFFRLENLTLSKSDRKVPRVDNVAQLLLQGLHSKDRSILRTALCNKDETVIRNTVKRLPVTVFEGLINELSSLVHGKTIL